MSSKAHTIMKRLPPIASNVYESFADTVGNTPLVRLRAASAATGCNIYGKAEFMSVGGSVKDRAGAWLVAEGERTGALTYGSPGIVMESTAGNTGIGLTLAARARGYRTLIVIPDTQTQEKKDILRNCGAHLIEVPAVPYKNPQNYVHVTARLHRLLQASSRVPVYYANQWDNLANRRSHYESTGPEIVAQMAHRGLSLHGFSCAMGTGGTLAGISEYLREHVPGVQCFLTDPQGALPYTYYTTGVAAAGAGSSFAEGIGQGRITGNMQGFVPDAAWEIDDARAMEELDVLCFEEGLQVGLSSGINVAGAIEVAKHLGPGHNLVTILCDGAARYSSKMFNAPLLRSKGLPVPRALDGGAGVELSSLMGLSRPLKELLAEARAPAQ